MVSEIADSDAESDLANNEPLPHVPNLAQHELSSQQASLSNLDFDQFIDPTQRLSGLSSSQNGFGSKGTGSTERMLQRLEKNEAGLTTSSTDWDNSNVLTPSDRKRALSTTEHASDNMVESGGKRKRPKTYGSKSRHDSLANVFVDLAPPPSISPISQDIDAPLPISKANVEPSNALDDPSDITTAAQTVPRQRDRPRRVLSLLEQSADGTPHRFTTSTSSMGGYQSINIDFRNSSNGLDINANPFGALSQASIDNARGIGGIGEGLQETGGQVGGDIDTTLALGQVQADMMTSPENQSLADTINPSLLTKTSEIGSIHSQERPTKRRKTEAATKNQTHSPAPARRAASVSMEATSTDLEVASLKKRGPTRKSSKAASMSPAPPTISEDHPHSSIEAQDEDGPVASQRRGSTKQGKWRLEPSPQISGGSESVSNTKRKRRTSKTQDTTEANSPSKQLTSEPNLSDEALIGLPKEKYVPRPSRSRSKQNAEAATECQVSSAEVADEQKAGQAVSDEQPPAKSSKAKGKKSKVKRAKTSAAALLKKSESMVSDGEDDVLWLDSKPAPVKLDLPPDLRGLKKEETQPSPIEKDDDQPPKESQRKPVSSVNVEIPAVQLADPANDLQVAPGSKKRGRKPPKDAAPNPAPEPQLEADGEKGASQARLPLSPKDTNASLTAVPSKTDPDTPVVTSSKPLTRTTPSPDKENISPSKGPTQHSPINPPNPFKTSTRYRVGLSKRQSIPSLLRKVDKDKPPPKKTSVKVQELKVKVADEDDDDGDGGTNAGPLRDSNGNLVEWF